MVLSPVLLLSLIAGRAAAKEATALQGVWLATAPSTFLYRLDVHGTKVVINQSPKDQAIHGYFELGEPNKIDLVLEHLGDAKAIYRLRGDTMEICVNSQFSWSRPSRFGQNGFETVHLQRRPPIRRMEEPTATLREKRRILHPTGGYLVGRQTFHIIDSSRDDPNITGQHQHYREWVVHLWYPATKSATLSRASYYPNLALVSRALGQNGMADELEDAAGNVANEGGNSYIDAQPVRKKFPLILFIPGQGYSSYHYTALIEDVVSHGYVVAGIEDTYVADAVVFENDRIEKFAQERWQQPRTYADTLSFDQEISGMLANDTVNTLRTLATLKPSIDRTVPVIDFTRVGVMGHSIGGRGVALAAQMNQKIRCCLDLDGYSPGGTTVSNFGGYGMGVPFMLIRSSDRAPSASVMSQAKMTQRNYEEWVGRSRNQRFGFYARTGSKALEVNMKEMNFDHASFSDLPLIRTNAGAGDSRLMSMIRALVCAFFDEVLKAKKGAVRNAVDKSAGACILRQFTTKK